MSFSLHDGQLAHMDALCHYRTERDGKQAVFNGYPQNLDERGCKDLAIDRMGPGYVTRGILVDMPRLRGVPWLEPSTPIYVSDLEAWEKFAGVTVGSGDVLLVRTGRWAKREKEGPWNYARQAAEAIRAYPASTVLIDHLAEPQMGNAVEYADVLDLAEVARYVR
jgi:hypothetical protein